MKRKYPVSYFLLGVLNNAIRYGFLLFIGIIFVVLGSWGMGILKSIGISILILYVALCIIEQFRIRAASLRQSTNKDFNEIMDSILGVEDHDGHDDQKEKED